MEVDMADDDKDTQLNDQGTQDDDASADSQDDDADAGADASQGDQDEVSLYRSRLNGQTAKVTSLTKAVQDRDAKIAELQKQRDDALAGLTSTDEALKAQIAAKDAEIAAERTARRTEFVQIKYPETFEVLGEAAANLTNDQLAANEARLAGAAEDGQAPTPRRTNAPKAGAAPAQQAEETADELYARLRTMTPDEAWQAG
jgi:hypothetical protein